MNVYVTHQMLGTLVLNVPDELAAQRFPDEEKHQAQKLLRAFLEKEIEGLLDKVATVLRITKPGIS